MRVMLFIELFPLLPLAARARASSLLRRTVRATVGAVIRLPQPHADAVLYEAAQVPELQRGDDFQRAGGALLNAPAAVQLLCVHRGHVCDTLHQVQLLVQIAHESEAASENQERIWCQL